MLEEFALKVFSKIVNMKASDADVAKRMDICRGCPEYKTFDSIGLEQCVACGCVLGIKAKLKFTECPKGKW